MKLSEKINLLWKVLSKARKKKLLTLGILSLISSVAEVTSIGIVFPFVQIISNSRDNSLPFVYEATQLLNYWFGEKIVIPATLLFIGSISAAAFVRIYILKIQTSLSMQIGADLSALVFENSLHASYEQHVTGNTSSIMVANRRATEMTHTFVYPIVNTLSSTILLASIVTMLLYLSTQVALFGVLTIGTMYILVTAGTRRVINSHSTTVNQNQFLVTKILQEGLGHFRDIFLEGLQTHYVKLYRASNDPLQRAYATIQVIGQVPRILIESTGIILIGIVITFSFLQGEPITYVMTYVGGFVIGIQRTIPLVQQIYVSIVTIRGNSKAIDSTVKIISQISDRRQGYQKIQSTDFARSIEFKGVSYRYPTSGDYVFKDLSFHISKGDRVAIVGRSGSGKSTLLDLLLGLISPTEGNIFIDDVVLNPSNIGAWSKSIAAVPQHVYLSDGSIHENITLQASSEDIDKMQLDGAINTAVLSSFIHSLPNGLSTRVGERGALLSGGQRQRVGIARALYKRSRIIILDEPTNGLDRWTESTLLNNLFALGSDYTLIFVTHSQLIVDRCTKVVNLDCLAPQSGALNTQPSI